MTNFKNFISDNKKLLLIIAAVIVATVIIIVGSVVGYKQYQAKSVDKGITNSVSNIEKGKTDTIKKLSDEPCKKCNDKHLKKGSPTDNNDKQSKNSDDKNTDSKDNKGKNANGKDNKQSKENCEKTDCENNGWSFKNGIYDQYDGINRASVEEVKSFMDSNKYNDVINNYATGTISIPSIDTKLPIIEGTTNEHLWAGATTYRADQSLSHGNYTLLSHNTGYDGMLFSSLGNVSKGDKIDVTSYKNGSKEKMTYRVTSKKVVSYKEGDVLSDTDEQKLTLITCDVSRPTNNRLVVTAEPV